MKEIKTLDIQTEFEIDTNTFENSDDSKQKLKHVLVFRTNVDNFRESELIVNKLLTQYPDHKINFDLEDCDNILRLECNGEQINHNQIITILIDSNYQCELLK